VRRAEGAAPGTEHIEADQHGVVDGRARGGIGVFAVEIVFDSVAEEQLISKDLFFAVQDGLARYVTAIGRRRKKPLTQTEFCRQSAVTAREISVGKLQIR